MPLYSRRISLQVGDIIIKELNIEFDVSKYITSEPNTLTAKIYNLSEDLRTRMASFPFSQGVKEKDGTTSVALTAGYKDDVSGIFVGRLRQVRSYREEGDIITEIEAGDGEKTQGVRFSRSYRAGTALKDVLRDLTTEMGIGIGNLDEQLATASQFTGISNNIANGISLHGYAVDILSKLLESRNLDWSIQDQALQILGFNKGLTGSAIKLDADSGLIGVPTMDNKGILTATTLMIPDMNPGKRVQISSEFVNGLFRITKANYKGSLFGSTYEINLEGKAPI